ncbi:MAG: hypothetical protein Q8L47_04740 [bacterium]|nr:hypothetical protein [bacterium]
MSKMLAILAILVLSATTVSAQSVVRDSSEHRKFVVGSFYSWNETNGTSVGHNLSWWWDDGVRDEIVGKTSKIHSDIKTLQFCYSKSVCYNWGGCEPYISQCENVTSSGSFNTKRQHTFIGGGYRLECDNESLISTGTAFNKNKYSNGFSSVQKVLSTSISSKRLGCVLYLPDGSGLAGDGWLSFGNVTSKSHDPNFNPNQQLPYPYPMGGGKG